MAIIKTALSADNHRNTPGRIEEAHRVHEAMLEDWTQRDVDFIGFAGDWNEVPPNERDQARSRDFLGRCAMQAPVVLIPGNHDPELSLSEFHVQSEYKYPITVVTQPDVIVVETKAGRLAVACVPFVWKAHLLAQLGPLSPEQSDQEAEQALSKIFLGLGVKARALNLPTVALIHGKWRGSKLNEEQPNRPLGMEISIPDLGQIGAQIYNVGHIHLHQSTEWDGFPILTPSSCFYVDFGESAHKKGYIYAEVPEDRALPAKWEHVPTPVTPMILLAADFANGAFEKWRTGQKEDHPITLGELEPQGVDFRFRYHYPKAEEKAAKGAAAKFKETLEKQGALNVKLDPVPIPAQTTRSLEIVKAKTLTDKASLLWAARGLGLTKEEETICSEMIEQLQTEFGFGQRLTLDAGIHVKRVRMKGWRCFPDELSFDFDAVDGEVIAVSGPNGVGKSLWWEIVVAGSLYRELPTHGNIGDHAIARDTFVETTFDYDGKEYTVSQIIDGKDGTGSSSLKIGTTPVFGTETALRTQYDKWAAANLPPFTLVKSTTFMPQESKGILGMGTKDRKALILRAKGAERYEILAEASGKRATAVDRETVRVKGQIEGLGEAHDLQHEQEVIADWRNARDTETGNLNTAEADLADARARATVVERQRTEYSTRVARRDELAGQVTTMRERRTQVDTRIQVSRELTDQKAAIEQAVVEVALLEVEIAGKPTRELELQLAQASAEEQRLDGERKALIKRADELIAQEQALSQRLVNNDTQTVAARALVADRDAIQKAVTESREYTAKWDSKRDEINRQRIRETELEGMLREVHTRINGNAQRESELTRKRNEALIAVEAKADVQGSVAAVTNRTKDIETVTAEIGRYRAEIEHLRSLIASASSTERTALRTGHQEIISGSDPIPRAVRAIEEADHAMEAASESPDSLIEVGNELRKCEEELTQYQRSLAGHQVNAARLPQIKAAEKTLAETISELETVSHLRDSLVEENNGIIAQQEELGTAQEQVERDLRWLQEQITGLESWAGRAELLATADTRIQGLEEQAANIKIDRKLVRATLASVQSEARLINTTIEEAARATKSIEERVTANNTTLADLQAKIKALKPTADKATLLAVAESAAEQLLQQLSALDKELEDLEHKYDQIEHQVDDTKPLEPVVLEPYETAVTEARAALADIQTRLALAEKDLADAEDQEVRRQRLVVSIRGLEKTTDRWNLVERTLGRDGLQAEDIAAAGDEINELTNELLHACGAEYTVDLKTTKLTKDGKREIEGCPINVYNSQTRQWQEGSTLSPGQRAFVNLPLSLALAMIGCRDSQVRPTLFQDEPTAGLDPERRPQYLTMMRHAVKKVNASKLFFVTHNEELMELADSRVLIDAGKVTVA